MSKDAKRVGILGGGQLGRMMLDPLHQFGVWTRVLDSSLEAPCRYVSNEFTCGSLLDYDTVVSWGRQCDVITIEIENVNVEALKTLAAEGVTVFPQPEILEIIQDKGLQKMFYQKAGIPTAPFILLDSPSELDATSEWAHQVLKLRRSGYDGKGVFLLTGKDSISQVPDLPCVIEQRADIAHEVAVLVARNEAGEKVLYPPVQMQMGKESHLLEALICPATLSSDTLNALTEIASQIVDRLGMVGILAIECFITKSGEIWVNEVSPRPHNSAHHTIESSLTSQFAQISRILLGYPLGSAEQVWPVSGLLNLVGPEGVDGAYWDRVPHWLGCGRVFVHHYGKMEVRPGRKLGHITVVGHDVSEVEHTLACLRKEIQ
jgi:5-(carboxyamino)imidazole ribonucleotide synthase